jgi:hypothetical protein
MLVKVNSRLINILARLVGDHHFQVCVFLGGAVRPISGKQGASNQSGDYQGDSFHGAGDAG